MLAGLAELNARGPDFCNERVPIGGRWHSLYYWTGFKTAEKFEAKQGEGDEGNDLQELCPYRLEVWYRCI